MKKIIFIQRFREVLKAFFMIAVIEISLINSHPIHVVAASLKKTLTILIDYARRNQQAATSPDKNSKQSIRTIGLLQTLNQVQIRQHLQYRQCYNYYCNINGADFQQLALLKKLIRSSGTV